MTPSEFAAKMQAFRDRKTDNPLVSLEDFHEEADNLMVEMLEELGYVEGAAIYESLPKWYE